MENWDKGLGEGRKRVWMAEECERMRMENKEGRNNFRTSNEKLGRRVEHIGAGGIQTTESGFERIKKEKKT